MSPAEHQIISQRLAAYEDAVNSGHNRIAADEMAAIRRLLVKATVPTITVKDKHRLREAFQSAATSPVAMGFAEGSLNPTVHIDGEFDLDVLAEKLAW